MAFTRGVGTRMLSDTEERAELLVGDRYVWDKGPRGWIKMSTALDSSAWRGCVDQDKNEM